MTQNSNSNILFGIIEDDDKDGKELKLSVVKRYHEHTTKKKPYTKLIVRYKNHTANAFRWSEHLDVEAGDIIKCTVKPRVFRGERSCDLHNIEKVELTNKERLSLLCDTKAIDMWTEIYIMHKNLISNDKVKQLVDGVLDRVNWEKFKMAPGAAKKHHAYVGGLIEHTAKVTRGAYALAQQYEDMINFDVLLASALLHDVCKAQIHDVDLESGVITTNQKLQLTDDHVALGYALIKEVGKLISVDSEIVGAIVHCIASHHGRLEWGAICEPQTKEALILHLADYCDSRIDRMKY